MPDDLTCAGFVDDFVETEVAWLSELKQRHGNDAGRQGELGVRQLAAVADHLPKIVCETPAQMKHVATLLTKLGYPTEAAMYLHKHYARYKNSEGT